MFSRCCSEVTRDDKVVSGEGNILRTDLYILYGITIIDENKVQDVSLLVSWFRDQLF